MILHGFAGYFESILYRSDRTGKQVVMSISPQSETPAMFSWFPLFIPLATPVRVQKEETITFHMWRYCETWNVHCFVADASYAMF
jgi:protein arginine N-methyltransferase 5